MLLLRLPLFLTQTFKHEKQHMDNGKRRQTEKQTNAVWNP